MILGLWPYSTMPMEASIRERLQCLEFRLRQSSHGGVKRTHYEQWLRDANIFIPTRSTLHLDLVRYRDMCDDINYGNGQRILTIDPYATRDACRWFLGEPWALSPDTRWQQSTNRQSLHPLRPKNYSSVARCILLAWTRQQEIELSYRAITGTSFRTHRGIPIGTIPGSDSAYIRLWRSDGRVMNLDVARIQGLVQWTHGDTSDYKAPVEDSFRIIQLTVTNEHLLRRLVNQFPGVQLQSSETATLRVPQSQCVMLTDLMEAWLKRHGASGREAQRSVTLNETTRLDVTVWDS